MGRELELRFWHILCLFVSSYWRAWCKFYAEVSVWLLLFW